MIKLSRTSLIYVKKNPRLVGTNIMQIDFRLRWKTYFYWIRPIPVFINVIQWNIPEFGNTF